MVCRGGGSNVATLGKGEAGRLGGSSLTVEEEPSSDERQDSADVEPQLELEEE